MSNLTVKGHASGTGTVIVEAPNTNTNRTITLPDATGTLATTADVAAIATGPTLGTAVASTSGTAIDFTGIPSTAKRVTVMLIGVSLTGSDGILIQIGSGSFLTSGYSSISGIGYLNSSGFIVAGAGTAGSRVFGSVILSLAASNSWVSSGAVGLIGGSSELTEASGGAATLSGALDRIRITKTGTNTFDAGTINISWE